MIWFLKKKDTTTAKPMDVERSKKGWFTRLKEQLASLPRKSPRA